MTSILNLYTCKAGSIDLIMLLSVVGANVHACVEESQCQTIHLAAESGSVGICHLLQSRDITIDKSDVWGNMLLTIACQDGYLEIVKFLLHADVWIRLY